MVLPACSARCWTYFGYVPRASRIVEQLCLFFLTFPDGRFVPRWVPFLGVSFLAFQIPGDLFPDISTPVRLLWS
jgi:hypothetical protein